MPPGQSLVVVHGWPEDEPPAHMFGRTLPSSPFCCPHVPLPIAGVAFSLCASRVPTGLARPDDMPIRLMKACPGLFFFFPLTLTMKLLATVPHEASPLSEAGAASFLSPLTPLTLANAFFKAVGVQAESPVWLTQSFTAKEH